MADPETLARVRTIVADCLDVEVEGIEPTSRLIPDLGADSLDFVDLIFTLEDRFKIKLRNSELAWLTRLNAADPEIIDRGFLTPAVLAKLTPMLPELAVLATVEKITPAKLFSLITVSTLANVVDEQKARANNPVEGDHA